MSKRIKECCGTCKHNWVDDDGEWRCYNENSAYYKNLTEYVYYCVAFELRKWWDGE